MSSKVLKENDYRQGLGDKYGRKKCNHCKRRRKINVHYQNTGIVLCTECSHQLYKVKP